MGQIIKDYQLFDKFVPNLYDFNKLKEAPYVFASYPPSFDSVCVLTKTGNILYPTTAVAWTKELEEHAENIFRLSCDNDLLVSYYKGNVEILYNYDTKEITTPVSNKFKPLESHQCLVFDEKCAPLRVSKTRIAGVLFLNLTTQFLYGNIKASSLDLVFDSLFYTAGAAFTPIDKKDLSVVVNPSADNKLYEEQYMDFARVFKKAIKKTEVPLLPETTGKVLFSHVLEKIPSVTKITDIELDMEVGKYGIKGMRVYPSGNLAIDVVRTYNTQTVGNIKDVLIGLLGHENFIVTVYEK